ncbi:MAG: phosphatase PAP2 family protein [Firmicutes bacterium]|nr:phosphatase PAP2 family protein [Bacillota bacterium]
MTNIDFSILYWIQDHIVCEALTPIMNAITTSGNGGIIWIILCVILICFKKTRWIGIAAAISLALVGILNNEIIKPIVERPRPFLQQEIELLIAAPGGFSFPSGHTSSSFAVATAVFLKNKKIGIPALIFAALVGFSRLYFFVHFPSDVFVGMLEGIFVAIAVTFAVDKLRNRYAEKKAAK